MTAGVFIIVLLGAALHASWNTVVKGGGDTMMTTVMVAGFAALIALFVLPFLAAPTPASWPFIGGSTVCQIVYFALVARTYRVSDMGQAYPLMRGSAPLLVALTSASLLGEPLSPVAWSGVVLIGAGIASMAVARGQGQDRAIWLALLNAAVIAGYTLIDGAGVRRSGSPASYTLWIFLLTGAPLVLGALAVRRPRFLTVLAGDWRKSLAGGFGAAASYGLALWAMTQAPIAVVAALRETSILFATAISALVLKEAVRRIRIAGAFIIVAGAVILRLS